MENYKISSILVPTDFSEATRNTLRTSIAMAKRQKATITLVHVVEPAYLLVPELGGMSLTLLSQMENNAKERLKDLGDLINLEYGIEVAWTVLSGNPADEICRWAQDKEISMIVMGTYEVSDLRKFFIGSTAYRVVKHSPCPVMTIPGSDYWPDFKRILFPVRMIPNALDQYEVVRPIIRRNGSSMLVVGLVEREDPVGLIKIREVVDTVRKIITEDKVEIKGESHYCNDIANHVLYLSNVEKPDLIVITETLEKSMNKNVDGRYTQQIVNHSKYPVLSIRPGMTKQKEVATQHL